MPPSLFFVLVDSQKTQDIRALITQRQNGSFLVGNIINHTSRIRCCRLTSEE